MNKILNKYSKIIVRNIVTTQNNFTIILKLQNYQG